ncbi:helix-turn-helix transcriptional regulator [Flavobacterium ovatum]|uniref:AraC family transcriptional regulator n=1 Tax=Flavobacterium ovatum TaxID=1928857 RepID=UPI00344B8FF2
MKNSIQQIKFNNKRKDSQFDLTTFDAIFSKKDLDHTLTDFQQIDFYMLMMITAGKGMHTVDFTDYTLQEGSILSIRKDQIHKFFKNDVQGYVLLFTDTFLVHFFNEVEVFKSLQLFNELITSPKLQLNAPDFQITKNLIDEIASEYNQIKDEHSMSVIGSLLHILFRKIYRIKTFDNIVFSEKKYLSSFIQLQLLVENQCFKTKKVSDYASQMNISSKTVNTITNTIIHKSAKEFIDTVLTTQIKRLLINTRLSVKEIAFQSGFEESTNLYKFFKKNTSLTPEAFRKANQ